MTAGPWRVVLDGQGRLYSLDAPALDSDERATIRPADVAGVEILAVAGEPPRLVLHLAAHVDLSGDSVILAVQAGSQREAVLGWLQTLDAGTLEQRALESLGGWGGAASTGEGFLAALRAEAESLP